MNARKNPAKIPSSQQADRAELRVPRGFASPRWIVNVRERWRRIAPPRLFLGSFLLLILLGWLGLMWLPGLYTGESLTWVDALFTATSAVCVTGLIVVDTATYFTTLGHVYLLVLIQLGGLGILGFTSLIIVALGQRLTLRHETLAAGAARVTYHVTPKSLVRSIVLLTFLIEAAGAFALWAVWGPTMGWGKAIWPAIFHSVSAFCNAGFSIYSDSLIGFQNSHPTLLIVSAVIVLGGLGFVTIDELLRRTFRRRHGAPQYPLSLHSRLVLITSAVLILGGWVLFTFFEWNLTFAELPVPSRITNGLFLSVTARTAGFNSIDYAAAGESSNFLTILLMTIGGSPGSTAGGIKTTTFALIGILAWSRLRGYEYPSAFKRTIPGGTVDRATGLFVLAFAIITVGILYLVATQMPEMAHSRSKGGFLEMMFEAVSAFNTVGLTMGITPELTTSGKWGAILLMFIGRVGPITFAAALARSTLWKGGEFRYAKEDVVIG